MASIYPCHFLSFAPLNSTLLATRFHPTKFTPIFLSFSPASCKQRRVYEHQGYGDLNYKCKSQRVSSGCIHCQRGARAITRRVLPPRAANHSLEFVGRLLPCLLTDNSAGITSAWAASSSTPISEITFRCLHCQFAHPRKPWAWEYTPPPPFSLPCSVPSCE